MEDGCTRHLSGNLLWDEFERFHSCVFLAPHLISFRLALRLGLLQYRIEQRNNPNRGVANHEITIVNDVALPAPGKLQQGCADGHVRWHR